MGWPGMAGKHQNPATHHGGRRRVCLPDLGASGVVHSEIWPARSSGVVLLPGWRV